MKVRELIEKLLHVEPDTEIVLSNDVEGNFFAPLEAISYGLYIPEGNYGSGEAFKITEREVAGKAAIQSVLLYPRHPHHSQHG
jgi:hypothetical protein